MLIGGAITAGRKNLTSGREKQEACQADDEMSSGEGDVEVRNDANDADGVEMANVCTCR